MKKLPNNVIKQMIDDRVKEMGMSYYKLSKLVNISRSVFTDAKKDDYMYTDDTLRRISSVLDLKFYTTDDGTPISLSEGALPYGYVRVPTYDIAFGAGQAYEPTYEEMTDVKASIYKQEFFDHLGINPHRCKRFRVKGDSMEPLILDGDTVLVNTAQSQINDNHIYVFALDGMLMIKRLRRTVQGQLIIMSENPSYSNEIVNLAEVQDTFKLIGEVVERTGIVR